MTRSAEVGATEIPDPPHAGNASTKRRSPMASQQRPEGVNGVIDAEAVARATAQVGEVIRSAFRAMGEGMRQVAEAFAAFSRHVAESGKGAGPIDPVPVAPPGDGAGRREQDPPNE